MSTTYAAALEAVKNASRKFAAVTAAYRALRIGDRTYLQARAEMKAAEAEFDAAYTAEAQGIPA